MNKANCLGTPSISLIAAIVLFAGGCASDVVTNAGDENEGLTIVTSDDNSNTDQSDDPTRDFESDAPEFTVKSGRALVNDQQIGTVAGLEQDPFGFFFVYSGSSKGGLFIVSDVAFDGAVEAGSFQGKKLDVSSGSYHLVFESAVDMLSDEARPAWVRHDSTYVSARGNGGSDSPFFGVSSELKYILEM